MPSLAIRSDYTIDVSVAQWKVAPVTNGIWSLENMHYSRYGQDWYLSNNGGVLGLSRTPFGWEIVSDPVGGHRINSPGTTQTVCSAAAAFEDTLVRANLVGWFPNDANRWEIQNA